MPDELAAGAAVCAAEQAVMQVDKAGHSQPFTAAKWPRQQLYGGCKKMTEGTPSSLAIALAQSIMVGLSPNLHQNDRETILYRNTSPECLPVPSTRSKTSRSIQRGFQWNEIFAEGGEVVTKLVVTCENRETDSETVFRYCCVCLAILSRCIALVCCHFSNVPSRRLFVSTIVCALALAHTPIVAVVSGQQST
jgi:hypothetical protein